MREESTDCADNGGPSAISAVMVSNVIPGFTRVLIGRPASPSFMISAISWSLKGQHRGTPIVQSSGAYKA